MNLRSVRLRLTLLYTLLSAIAVAALVVVGARLGTEPIEDGAVREGAQSVADTVRAWNLGEEPMPDNFWMVSIDWDSDEVSSEPLGDFWVEPPLESVGRDAIDYEQTWTEFSQDGTSYLAYGEKVSATEAAVTLIDLEYYRDRSSSLRLRLWLAGAGAVVGIAVVGWFVSGRALSPVRAANTRQRDFIADAAHQLRTPLAVIRASASQTLSKPRDADAYVESLREIDSAAESAGAAVSELLELARIDSGQFAPRLAPLRLDLLVEEVVAGVRVEGCEIVANTPRSITVAADYALLHHAVENVVRNAASRAGDVTVTARVEGKDAVVEVVDDGPGFPDELLPEVFERFRRGDSRGSSGLGLAIARSLVEAHKGRAEAANAETGGAVVRLRLPVSSRS